MELSNMLIDGLKGQAMEQIAKKIGVDSKTVKALAGKALPMILGGLEEETKTPQGAEALDKALAKHDGGILESLGGLNLEDGSKIIGHIFGNSQKKAQELAKETGTNEKQASGVMAALGPIVMGALGKQKASGGLEAQDLMKLLSGTGKDGNILSLLDQDGDGDFDKQDAIKFGMGFIMKKFFGKK